MTIEQSVENDWKQLAVGAPDGARVEVKKLKPATAYKFRLVAFNGKGDAVSPTIEVKTLAPPPPGKGSGLLARYYTSKYMTGAQAPKVEANLNFDWSQSAPDGLKVGDFGARFTGEIAPRFSEDDTFEVTNSGQRLWVDGQLVIDGWTSRARRGSIALEAGERVPIKWEVSGQKAQTFLTWKSDSTPAKPIPTSQLFPAAAPQPEITLTSGGTKVEEGKTLTFKLRAEGAGAPTEIEYELDGSAVADTDYKALPDRLESATSSWKRLTTRRPNRPKRFRLP